MSKINKGLLIIAVVTSITFIFIVEYFNNLTLDDLAFGSLLYKESIWKFIVEMYFTWQGRFMGFLVTGIQLKSYYLFNSMLPFSIVLYILNIALVSKALTNLLSIKTFESIIYAILFFQLYIYSMFDISSYFWLCTKGYTFIISLSLFALSELVIKKQSSLFDYFILFLTFAFLGCSYEIYAPVILLLISCVLLYRLHLKRYQLKLFISENKRLLFSLIIGILFFILMVIAPGNWVRMKVHSKDSELLFSDYTVTVSKNGFKLIKLLFFKIHYFLVAGVLLWGIVRRLKITFFKNSEPEISKKLIVYFFTCVLSSLLTILLSVYAVGARMELRAFNHINLIFFLLAGFIFFEFAVKGLFERLSVYAFPFSIAFIIICNIYSSIKSFPELKEYQVSVLERSEIINSLKATGNKETVKLKPLNVAEFHSVDDLWRLFIPKFTPRILLKPNEVSNWTGNFYNEAYRKYYNLDFDLVTDLSYDLKTHIYNSGSNLYRSEKK